MSEGMIPIKKAIPIIVVAWVLSLVTTLALVYVSPSIFPPLKSGNISDGAIVANNIAEGAIMTTKLADGTVTSAKILDGTITATDLADGSVLTLKIADGAITTTKIADGGVTSAKVADNAIVTLKLANGSVTTSKIVDNAIVTAKLADGTVTSAKIVDATITASDLATGAVSEVKIADGAVTTSKIADYAITSLKLASGAIPFNATSSTSAISTTSTTWVNMTGMSVDLTLTRNSTLLIMLSAEAWLDASGDWIIVRALVNSTIAYPRSTNIPLTFLTDEAAYSYIFYLPNVTAGSYTIYIQWYLWNGVTTGRVDDRSLSVIAFPA